MWEGIIAPSIRLEIRYELFKMRDAIRRLKIEYGDQFSNELFDTLQHTINNEIGLLHHATIGDFYKAYKKYGNKEQLPAEIEKLEQLIKDCPISEVRDIWTRSVAALVIAFIVNTGGWLIYIVPIIITLVSLNSIRKLAKILIGLSTNDVNKLFPQSPRHLAS